MKKLILILFIPLVSFSSFGQSPEDVEVPLDIIEKVPVFPGCKRGNNENKRKCMSEKIAKFFKKISILI